MMARSFGALRGESSSDRAPEHRVAFHEPARGPEVSGLLDGQMRDQPVMCME
jgi:hypothetical protein